jgi:hypothetical protein
MNYKNTQIGVTTLLTMMAPLLVSAYLWVREPAVTVLVSFSIIGLVAILFSSLTIEVNKSKIIWFFGPYFWKKSIKLIEIESVEKIETKLYQTGIRKIHSGWLYSVAGLSAVALELKNGTTVSLGTNDADNLLHALRKCS